MWTTLVMYLSCCVETERFHVGTLLENKNAMVSKHHLSHVSLCEETRETFEYPVQTQGLNEEQRI